MLKYRQIFANDLIIHNQDIYKCYQDNKLILDEQTIIDLSTPEQIVDFIYGFIQSSDSMVVGIFDQQEQILFGLVIYDNIRIAETSCAEVHIAVARELWGKLTRNIFTKILNESVFDILYCQIPQIAVRAISMCKHLGFKKTGYVPKALPYTNSKGECKMYDINFYTYQRGI
ncbi:MAG: hypothetical protein NC218_08365 [Acetobacter sp.]|nr:hypothetical protein [Acetobacter sp.]